MKVLFITKEMNQKCSDGGFVVTLRNYKLLTEIFGETKVDILEIGKPNLFTKLVNCIFSQAYGQNRKVMNNFLESCKNNYDIVFFNSSLYGNLVNICKSRNIKTCVFYHNIEKKYYMDMFINKKNILTLMFFLYAAKMEKLTTKKADYIITLNSRDDTGLFTEYSRRSNLVLPISFDKINKDDLVLQKNNDVPFCLFIGSGFFANIEGVSWFIDNVVPYISIRFKIIGSICNSLKDKYKNNSNVDFLGYVDDISDWYKKARFIVSPIFLGSGMKTKTVEALAYGKSIIGTDEAFVGIDADFSMMGAKCNTALEFIDAINSFTKQTFNDYSYTWFCQNLSTVAIKNKLIDFLFNEGYKL